jgi:hypothetical protein
LFACLAALQGGQAGEAPLSVGSACGLLGSGSVAQGYRGYRAYAVLDRNLGRDTTVPEAEEGGHGNGLSGLEA